MGILDKYDACLHVLLLSKRTRLCHAAARCASAAGDWFMTICCMTLGIGLEVFVSDALVPALVMLTYTYPPSSCMLMPFRVVHR